MKIRLDKLTEAMAALRSHVTGYRSEDNKLHSIEVTVSEPDLNKGVPLSVLTLAVEFQKDDKQHSVNIEVYDDMESVDPIVTHTTKESIKSR